MAIKKIGRIISAPIAGYVVIVIGALLFQDALFGRVTHDSSWVAISIGGGLTALACVLAGYVVGWIAPMRPVLAALPLLVWLAIETTLIHLRGMSPFWFDVAAGGSNIVGVVCGLVIWTLQSRQGEGLNEDIAR